MFKLVYVVNIPGRGEVYQEELFTKGEKRLAVEVAREKRDNPKFIDVSLYDFCEVKTEVVTIEPVNPEVGRHEPVEVSRFTTKAPACVVVDLSRLPKLPKAKAPPRRPIAVTANAFDLPAPVKKVRVTKRDRKFADAAVS